MNITIIGTGFVGVVSSAVFASFDHAVYGLDIDEKKIDKLNHAHIPFYEPGLEELVKRGREAGKLTFTTDYKKAIEDADVILIAVGTPSAADGQADLSYVFASAKSLAPYLKKNAIVAVKSTVPPGTCDKVHDFIKPLAKHEFHVASLPEFLREGSAVEDTLHPDRVIIGATEKSVIETLRELHRPFEAPIIVMKPASAQMCKYASNAYLATRITFVNQIANLCELNGANVLEVIKGIGFDKRIGSHYWYPGFGYGGSCFPKDVKELAAYARSVGQEDNLMVTVSELNDVRVGKLMNSFESRVGGFNGKRIAVLGLSFKPNTDDMREAPSLKVIPILLEKGAIVAGYDPMANSAAKTFFSWMKIEEGKTFEIKETVEAALTNADGVIVLIEWPQLTSISPEKFASTLKKHAFFIDARDQFDGEALKSQDLKYIGVGV